MTGWITLAFVFGTLGLISSVAAIWLGYTAHIRIKDQGTDHDSLVAALNAAGAELRYTADGYQSGAPHTAPLPLADVPGELPGYTIPRPSHALRDPIVSPPPPLPTGVRDWLLHYSAVPDVSWAGVVEQFYNAAAGDPEIAAYFANVDMATLKKHFTATMIIVTRDGISASTVQAMRHAHHGIIDRDGAPMAVTGAAFDRTIGVLASVLDRNGVPGEATAALARTIAPLRAAIVCDAHAQPGIKTGA